MREGFFPCYIIKSAVVKNRALLLVFSYKNANAFVMRLAMLAKLAMQVYIVLAQL